MGRPVCGTFAAASAAWAARPRGFNPQDFESVYEETDVMTRVTFRLLHLGQTGRFFPYSVIDA